MQALLADAERTDAAEDAVLGGRRGDELPAELARRQSRLAVIRKAKADLEAEHADKARAKAEQAAATRGADERATRSLNTLKREATRLSAGQAHTSVLFNPANFATNSAETLVSIALGTHLEP